MSRWPSFFSFFFFWAPVPNKATVSVDVKQHFNHGERTGRGGHGRELEKGGQG